MRPGGVRRSPVPFRCGASGGPARSRTCASLTAGRGVLGAGAES
ncbi:hypothetical protein STRTUCAR8_06707 [Streptomyces turgidiscabies Car8]|uniref:Uncharacterized protein n=1 Tax=Streptomyces turgidiscabies (strain Car8) TaxID=698760 RepID=L7ERL6_STRT8|nr:hypothetical protein STRTUCAR8_06707 [Streptomyces turgidiscabies Car8]